MRHNAGILALLVIACGGGDEGGRDEGNAGADASAGGSGARAGSGAGAASGSGGAGGAGAASSGGAAGSPGGGNGGVAGSDAGPGAPDASAGAGGAAGGASGGGGATGTRDASTAGDSGACVDGSCPVCVPGALSCSGNVPRVCDASGQWVEDPLCAAPTAVCLDGVCVACAPGARGCVGDTPRGCDATGAWVDEAPCSGATPACDVGACVTCREGSARCSGQVRQTCDATRSWVDLQTCGGATPLCTSVGCFAGGSCSGSTDTCGAQAESCCAVEGVEGSTFDRSNDPAAPATVSAFALDRYEVTVGRFRQFVADFPGGLPADGEGAHPLIPGSGWQSAWAVSLPVDSAALMASLACRAGAATWTDTAGAGETLPVNCVTWFEAFAFCAWDGGRLATEAEWNAAAAGGNEQREYPWSSPPSSVVIDPTHAAYFCLADGANGCKFEDILRVGSLSPTGDGRWGHADLAGNIWEWALDVLVDPYPTPCADCAEVTAQGQRVARGGSYDRRERFLLTSDRASFAAGTRSPSLGIRCARDAQP